MNFNKKELWKLWKKGMLLAVLSTLINFGLGVFGISTISLTELVSSGFIAYLGIISLLGFIVMPIISGWLIEKINIWVKK